jgi:ATP/maltotriose-dependent transcriptional regulator MalT
MAESGKILYAQSKTHIPREKLEYIHLKTKGWAAVLVLMANSIMKGHSMPRMADISTSEEIFAYFASEIFAELDQRSQNFLTKTAFLPKITPEMAQSLTGSDRVIYIVIQTRYSRYKTT